MTNSKFQELHGLLCKLGEKATDKEHERVPAEKTKKIEFGKGWISIHTYGDYFEIDFVCCMSDFIKEHKLWWFQNREGKVAFNVWCHQKHLVNHTGYRGGGRFLIRWRYNNKEVKDND